MFNALRIWIAGLILPDRYVITRDYTRAIRYVELESTEYRRIP